MRSYQRPLKMASALTLSALRTLIQQLRRGKSLSPRKIQQLLYKVKLTEPPLLLRIVRKIDTRLMPFTVLIYLLCYMDRSNIGMPQLSSLQKYIISSNYLQKQAMQRF